MNEPMQPQPQPQEQPSGAAMQSPPARGGNEPSPAAPAASMKDAFQRVVQAAMEVLYSKGTSDGVVAMLQKGEPANALAQTTLFVMKALFDESGGKVPAPVMGPAARAVLALIAEMGVAMGLPFNDEVIAKAVQLVDGSLQKRFGGGEQGAQPKQPPAQPPARGGLIDNAKGAENGAY